MQTFDHYGGHSLGDWGADDFCDPGEYAIGFQVGSSFNLCNSVRKK